MSTLIIIEILTKHEKKLISKITGAPVIHAPINDKFEQGSKRTCYVNLNLPQALL
jgi:hypothetical protein